MLKYYKEFRAMKTSLCREPGSILALIAEEGMDSDQLAEDSGGLISYVCLKNDGKLFLPEN
jgi:hypothetical protein